MVEIELRYEISKEPNLKGFTLIKEKSQKDIYFDTQDFQLLRSGNFVRVRNDARIDFKLNIGDYEHNYCKETNFDTVKVNGKNKDFLNVFKTLGVNINKNFKNFEEFIKLNNFVVLAPVVKERKVYSNEKDDVTIYIDKLDGIGMFLEAEVIIDDKVDINKEEIILDIKKFLADNKLIKLSDKQQKIGYVELYLLKNNKAAYELGIFKQ